MATNGSTPTAPDTIVLIHGLWMTGLSWEHWAARYTAQGFTVIARSWPGMDIDIEELRRDPSAIEHLGIGEIVDFYDALVRDLDSPPMIIGHSFGGAFTEILLAIQGNVSAILDGHNAVIATKRGINRVYPARHTVTCRDRRASAAFFACDEVQSGVIG